MFRLFPCYFPRSLTRCPNQTAPFLLPPFRWCSTSITARLSFSFPLRSSMASGGSTSNSLNSDVRPRVPPAPMSADASSSSQARLVLEMVDGSINLESIQMEECDDFAYKMEDFVDSKTFDLVDQGVEQVVTPSYFIDLSIHFTTTIHFPTKDELLSWARSIAKSLGFVITIKSAEKLTSRSKPRVMLECDRGE